MRVAVTGTGPSPQAAIDPRFGRCAYFVFVDTDTMDTDAIENPVRDHGGGAGIQAARVVVGHGATMVLTGHCGPNAHRTLSAAGIGIVVGCSGTVEEAIGRLEAGQWSLAPEPDMPSHAGSPGPR